MKPRTTMLALAGALLATLAACKPGGSPSPFVTLDHNATSLRERFNADVGKVRVVMLVAPT